MRQPTPDILATPTPTPGYNLAADMLAAPPALAPALRYDYAALGAAGPAIRLHALAIKVAEGRANDAVIDAGNHLNAVKASLDHGQWLDWLEVEFAMSDRTARTMMSIAERFGGKMEKFSDLGRSVLGLLSSPSVPDEAVAEVMAAETSIGKVSVAQAKAIIASHKAQGRCRICHRPLTDPTAAARGIGAYCEAHMARGNAGYTEAEAVEDKPLPAWAQPAGETVAVAPDFAPVHLADAGNATPALAPAPPRGDSGAAVVEGTDERTALLGDLAAWLEGWIVELRDAGDLYGRLTGDFTTPLEIKHRLERMQVRVQANRGDGGWE